MNGHQAAPCGDRAEQTSETDPAHPFAHLCPCCGGRIFIIDIFEAGSQLTLSQRRSFGAAVR